MTYENKVWLKSEIETGGWTPYTEYENKPFDGETVEIIALDMDSYICTGTAVFHNPPASAEYFTGITVFPELRVSRVQAWRRNKDSVLSPEGKYICDHCEYSPAHSHKWQKCSCCRFNRHLKDNHKYVVEAE